MFKRILMVTRMTGILGPGGVDPNHRVHCNQFDVGSWVSQLATGSRRSLEAEQPYFAQTRHIVPCILMKDDANNLPIVLAFSNFDVYCRDNLSGCGEWGGMLIRLCGSVAPKGVHFAHSQCSWRQGQHGWHGRHGGLGEGWRVPVRFTLEWKERLQFVYIPSIMCRK